MSASKEKRNRSALRAEGTESKKAAALSEQEKKNKAFKTKTIIAVIAFVLVIAAALFITSDYRYNKKTAVEVGGTKYSAAEVSYFYTQSKTTIYNELASNYGDYVSYFLDTNTPWNEQEYSEGQTWADYAYESALNTMKQVTAFCDAAKQEGRTISAEGQASVDSAVAEYASYATMYGYSDLDGFLAGNFGKGMNEKLFRDLLERSTLASEYASSINDGFTYSDADLEAYYAAGADDYDYISYYSYFVYFSNEAFDGMEESAKLDAAIAKANEIAGAADETEFLAKIAEFAGEENVPEASYDQGALLTASYKDFLLGDRTAGDTFVAETETGAYAVMFLNRDDNNYKMVSMRHILVNAEASEDGTWSEEALAAAKEEAERIYAEWLENPTEDHFAELANTYSEDSGSNTNGGLYEKVYKNYMVKEINDFLFEQGNTVGDSAVVYGSNGSYAGYHVVYFAGEGELLRHYMADYLKRNEDYTAFTDGLLADLKVTEGPALHLVNRV